MTQAATRSDAVRVKISGVEVSHLVAVGTVPGVVVMAAAAMNGPGRGRMSRVYENAARSYLRWTAPGSVTPGTNVPVTSNGDYLLEDGSDPGKWLRVRVYVDHLPASYDESLVYLEDVYNDSVAGRDVTASEASTGDVATYTVSVVNESPAGVFDVRAWLDGSAAGSLLLELSDDGASWVTPTSEVDASVVLLGDIAAGVSKTLHLRRTIGAGAGSNAEVLTLVHMAWTGA